MTAKHLARPLLTKPEDAAVCVGPALVPAPQPVSTRPVSPSLRAAPLGTEASPRRFARVPTHAVGVHPEQREYPRATLKLPLKLRSVNSVAEDFPITLATRDIGWTGVHFLCPEPLSTGIAAVL